MLSSQPEDSQIFSQGAGNGKYQLKRKSRESIEPEEILLDAEVSDSLLDERKIEVPIRRKVFLFFLGVCFVVLLVLFFRVFWLQVVQGEKFSFLAERNRVRTTPDLPPRGIIFDKNMQPLVANVPSFDLLVISQDFHSISEESIFLLSEILEISLDLIKKELSKVDIISVGPILFMAGLDGEKALALEARAEDLVGFVVARNSKREYLFAEYFSHVLGYTAKINPQEIQQYTDYFMTERVGRAGLELKYQSVLRGQPGKKEVEIDSLGRQTRQILEVQAQPGNNMVLNIDSKLQRKIHNILKGAVKEKTRGAAVALDPRNGRVLALVSLPSFDSNLFVRGLSDQEFSEIEKEASQPFFNRAISGQYPPGSTIKPLIAAAALQENIISPSSKINCLGKISVPSQYNPDIVFNFIDWKVHGVTDVYSAIADSCNVFFYTVGGGFGKIEGLGPEKLAEYSSIFGLGQRSGIDLLGEEAGLVPSPSWKINQKKERWYIGDTYHFSIGQGDVLVTPLQIAQLTSVIANKGTLWQPQIVDRIIDLDKNTLDKIQPKALKRDFISRKNLETVRDGMRQAVTIGSARLLADLGVAVAGKTGTAQVNSEQDTHAWFTAFAPFDDPEIVVTVLVENAGEGSAVAVPLVKEILKWYFDNH